ncbi:hypothetical protein CK203_062537 [Vitis vinifera]|uniref:Reverse transcriptase RNase H-like domain-containing protein n=1 Tax=Vitis vinifera TaxID=29760 RepID=A0A438FWS7_VITVI|nr:hypothetical protein CK203_062537 [Vitis vinifera]
MVHKGLSLGTSSPSKALKLTKQRRFIKDFSKLARPLCELLVKDAKFIWDDRCQRSFEELKLFLTTAPIVRAPNWQLPFEFRAYLVGSFIVVFTDHSALKYLLTKQDAKARLIRWISCFKSSISDQRQERSGECGSRPPFKASYRT